MSLESLWRFGDVALDLDKVMLVADGCVVMADGKMYGVGVETANAVRSAIPAFRGPLQDTRGTAQTVSPVPRTASVPHEPQSSTVQAQLLCRTRPITSFPGHGPMTFEDDAEAGADGNEKTGTGEAI